MFHSEKKFFEFLGYAKDQRQKKNLVQLTNKSQYNILKNIAKKILNGDIYLGKVQFRFLKNKKLFLRKLSQGEIKIKNLQREYSVICYIVKIGLEYYETHSKISSRTCRKVGKNRRQYSREGSSNQNSSSEEYISGEESCISSEESESEESTRFGETSIPETNSDVSFSNSGEEEESN